MFLILSWNSRSRTEFGEKALEISWLEISVVGSTLVLLRGKVQKGCQDEKNMVKMLSKKDMTVCLTSRIG